MMINHFGHRHPLSPFKVDNNHKDEEHTICSGCELDLICDSSGYKCNKAGCDFRLHEMCYELCREIRHSSHSGHSLVMHFTPPPSFSCSACGESGTAFIYSCPTCRFGLHVRCSALPDSLDRHDLHSHPLNLVFSLPERSGHEYSCGACGLAFPEGCWAYFCADCGFGAHLECAASEELDEDVEAQREEDFGCVDVVNLVIAETQKAIAV